jgi:uncharacterized protein YbjT (DUF2867 family)
MVILLFGATGSAGGSVLRVCLASPLVTEVRAVVRRPTGLLNFKLREIVHADYLDFSAIAPSFEGVDACCYCLGISVMQVSGEEEYRRITHDMAMAAARTLKAHSPNATFHYISGRGASLSSRQMWARVKAETERDLMAFNEAVCWRPAAIDGMPSEREPAVFKIARPILRVVFGPFRGLYVKGGDIGAAMLQATTQQVRRRIIENAELRDFADAWNRKQPEPEPHSSW